MLSLVLALACADPVDRARDQADQDHHAAVTALEAFVAANPESGAGLEALGDLHLEAALSGEREVHLAAALDAYTRAHAAQGIHGPYRAKLALVQQLMGEEAGVETARQAWDRTRTPLALPLTVDAVAQAEGLRELDWTAGAWKPLPSWGPPGPGGRFIVRRAGTPTRVEGEGEAPPALDALFEATVVDLGDGRVLFDDRAHPRHVSATGYVDGRAHCDQPYGELTCRGRQVRDRQAEIHAGPCWHDPVEAVGEGTTSADLDRLEAERQVVDPDLVRLNTLRCVPGAPAAQAEHCPDLPGSCEVVFQRISYPTLSVEAAQVWLVPPGAPSPVAALALVEDEGLRGKLARGQVAIGLPEPLVRWAARPDGRLPDLWEAEEGHLTLVWEGEDGAFVVRDGILVEWTPAR